MLLLDPRFFFNYKSLEMFSLPPSHPSDVAFTVTLLTVCILVLRRTVAAQLAALNQEKLFALIPFAPPESFPPIRITFNDKQAYCVKGISGDYFNYRGAC